MRHIGQLRNITEKLSKIDIIYPLIPSESAINEKRYIIDSNKEICNKINDIRLQPFNVSPYLNKNKRSNIKKRLYDIGKLLKNNKNMENKLLKELNNISSDLKFA